MIKMPVSPRGLNPIIMACLVLSLAVLACVAEAGAPAPETSEEPIAALPTQFAPQEPSEGGEPSGAPKPPATAIPAIPEQRRLTYEYPAQIRAGDSDVVRLTLEVDDLGGITPTAQFEGNVVTGGVVEIPDLYETHNVIAEAKFDIAGLEVSPPELVSQTLSKGQAVNFFWSVRPTDVGVYRGTIWFYLRFVDKTSGEESRTTVAAQVVSIEASNVLGLPAGLVRAAGGVGSVVGAVIGFPFFEDIIKFLIGRRKGNK